MKSPIRRCRWLAATILIFVTLSMQPTWAKWVAPTEMPVARLLQNVRGYVKQHPKDASGYYTLGRINSAAFAWDKPTVPVYIAAAMPSLSASPALPTVVTLPSQTPPARDRAKPVSPLALTYLSDALTNYKKASTLNAADALIWLGLGFQCEEALPFPQAVAKASTALALPGKPPAEKLRQEALRCYRKAYELSVKTDEGHVAGLENTVSAEAAQYIIGLQKNRSLSPMEQAEIVKLQATVNAFNSSPRYITPILISFQRQARLTDLLAPEKSVRFDLAGDGLNRRWPWVKPTTGILVWNPKHTGKITSGLQLFGSVTWWLFWKDGYGPLAALDNDHNGWLEGAELKGIAVWFDRNGDGVSQPGEVVPLASLGIRRIAVHASGLNNGVPANEHGVELRDGTILPTFDWTPSSLP